MDSPLDRREVRFPNFLKVGSFYGPLPPAQIDPRIDARCQPPRIVHEKAC